MKEQGPNLGQNGLTNQADSLKLKRRGDIMQTTPGGGGPELGAPNSGEPTPQPEALRLTPEQLDTLRAEWRGYMQGVRDADERETLATIMEDLVSRGISPERFRQQQEGQAGARRAARGVREEQRYGYFSNEDGDAIKGDDVARERIFEEIFIGIDAKPGERFQLSLDAASRLDKFYTILNDARVYDNGRDITDSEDLSDIAKVAKRRQQLSQEFSGREAIRRVLHDANWSVSEGGGEIREFAGAVSTFKSEHVDLIFRDPLVGTALRMFEQAFQQIKAENGGQLPYQELAWDPKADDGRGGSKLEDRVWSLMRESLRIRTDQGGVEEWRLRRAIILARGFGVFSLRFPEIAAQARLPEESTFASATERASRYGSIYGEAIARYLDPLEHLIEKFAIGEEDRALLYYFLTGDHARITSREQLRKALKMKSHLDTETMGGKRLIDVINLFRIGGPFSQSSWRQFMSMRDFSPEQMRRSGLGILEGRVSGDVEDEIRQSVRNNPRFAGRGEDDPELKDEIERQIKRDKEGMVLQRRLAMWKDALKANPLRVMWQWEEKTPGQRIRFLSEALSVSEAEARELLSTIEQDLMIIQEDTVQRLGRGDVSYNDAEMLDFDKIEDPIRRERVRKYVLKIREKASANDYAFIKSLFEKTPAEKSPFPFVIGFEDIPFSDFDFINTGGRGFARRINDYAASVTAANELVTLITAIPTTHDIGPLIESLNKIKQAVALYDKSIAMEVVPYLARGIIRMYDKDLLSRLPLGVGTVVGMLHDSSFAQETYGRAAMSWTEGDKYNFTTQLLHNGLIQQKDLEELRKEVGATKLDATIDILRTYGQLTLLLMLWGFTKALSESEK